MENNKYYVVRFTFNNGEEKSFLLKSDAYLTVSKKILKSEDGWFGIRGNYVNLSNVNEVFIDEIDPENYHYDKDSFVSL